ncbi:MAG: TrkH family potassium uptake protein [Desulfatibacillaceae bacterium]
MSPPKQLVLSFATLILVGTALLSLPAMTPGPGRLPLPDALFTATSAVCVTGLIVVDTATAFTVPGQVVILVLLQLGGLGIMTFSVFVLMILGRRISMGQDNLMEEVFTQGPFRDKRTLVFYILVFTLVAELVGALVFFSVWGREYQLGHAVFLSVFHAISAFCNAGFSLFSNSLTDYAANPVVVLNTAVLIILGGLGFFATFEIAHMAARKAGLAKAPRRNLSLHTRLVLASSTLLLLFGAVFFLFVEYNHAMAEFSIPVKLMTAFFQSVTARTAGFNTVDFGHISNAVALVFILLMFIGASPGSCGGGIKTTTLAVMVATIRHYLMGHYRANLFARSIPRNVTARAMGITIGSAAVITVSLVALLLTQLGDAPHDESRGMFLELFFEAVSAYGTVGLSMGATEYLNTGGKAIVIMLMFVGRLGPLTVALSFVPRKKKAAFEYSEENVMIG